jgi:methylated-DNA-protein-cysteine methyltransferase-like protein
MTSSFFQHVYRVVSMIPTGHVATYGQIAAYLGNPRAARAVGWALRALPEAIDVPWHRVINAQGRISTSGREHGAHEQRAMLEEEGVIFDEEGCTDLKRYRWEGPR